MGPTLDSFMSDLSGKVAMVTGGHTGLGFGTVLQLAKHGARVYIASRSGSKVRDAKKEILDEYPGADVHFLSLDLTDLASVHQAVETFSQQESALHLLVNNAGVMCIPYKETKDGFETQIAGLPTDPVVCRTAEAGPKGTVRIVNVSSDGHAKLAPKQGVILKNMNMKGDFSVWARYGHSKLANVLHTKELAKRYKEILSISLHPGTVKTNLSQGPLSSTFMYRFLKPLVELGAPGPREGASNILFAAVSPALSVDQNNGAYLLPVGKVSDPSKAAQDPRMAHDLWVWTEEELKARGF